MAKRPCCIPGCPALIESGSRCAAHKQNEEEAARVRHHRMQYDKTRPNATKRGYGKQHRIWRAAILKRDPVCVVEGCSEPSTVADHIVPLRQGGGWRHSNGQGMCEYHHNVKRQRESLEARGYGPENDGGGE